MVIPKVGDSYNYAEKVDPGDKDPKVFAKVVDPDDEALGAFAKAVNPDGKDAKVFAEAVDSDGKDPEVFAEAVDSDDEDLAGFAEAADPDDEDLAGFAEAADPDDEDLAGFAEAADPDDEDLAGFAEAADPDDEDLTGFAETADSDDEDLAGFAVGTSDCGGLLDLSSCELLKQLQDDTLSDDERQTVKEQFEASSGFGLVTKTVDSIKDLDDDRGLMLQVAATQHQNRLKRSVDWGPCRLVPKIIKLDKIFKNVIIPTSVQINGVTGRCSLNQVMNSKNTKAHTLWNAWTTGYVGLCVPTKFTPTKMLLINQETAKVEYLTIRDAVAAEAGCL